MLSESGLSGYIWVLPGPGIGYTPLLSGNIQYATKMLLGTPLVFVDDSDR